jgi:hypothetical protein
MVLTEYFAVLVWFILLMLYTELHRPVISIFSPAGWTNMQQAKTGCHVLFEFESEFNQARATISRRYGPIEVNMKDMWMWF